MPPASVTPHRYEANDEIGAVLCCLPRLTHPCAERLTVRRVHKDTARPFLGEPIVFAREVTSALRVVGCGTRVKVERPIFRLLLSKECRGGRPIISSGGAHNL